MADAKIWAFDIAIRTCVVDYLGHLALHPARAVIAITKRHEQKVR